MSKTYFSTIFSAMLFCLCACGNSNVAGGSNNGQNANKPVIGIVSEGSGTYLPKKYYIISENMTGINHIVFKLNYDTDSISVSKISAGKDAPEANLTTEENPTGCLNITVLQNTSFSDKGTITEIDITNIPGKYSNPFKPVIAQYYDINGNLIKGGSVFENKCDGTICVDVFPAE